MSELSKTANTKVIENQAAAWLAQLDGGNMSSQDLADFQEWLSRSPLHQIEINKLTSIWADLNALTHMAEPIFHASAAERKLRKPDGLKASGKLLSLAVVCVFLVFITLASNSYVQRHDQNPPTLITTSIGEQRLTILPDASTVSLNTNTKIEIDYNSSERKVRLLSGEAVFDVVPDKQRPFLVYADEGIIRAVGTVFSVRIQNGAVKVAVTEGAVELSHIVENSVASDKKQQVQAVTGFITSGHKAVLENRRTIIEPVAMAQIQETLSWQHGLLTFSGEPLSEVVAEMSRYTTLKITIGDPEIRNLRIGGVFPAADTETFFEALEGGFGITATKISPTEVVLNLSSQQ